MTKRKLPFLSIPFLVILGRVGGFLIPFLIAFVYGAGPATDAFFLAFWIAYFFVGLFTHLLESVLIPYLMEYKKHPEKVSSIANGVGGISFLAVLACGLGTGLFLALGLDRVSGLSREYAGLVARVFLEMSPLLFFGVLISSAHSVFYTYKVFWFPAISPAIRSLAVIFFIWALQPRLGIHAAGWGFALGETLRGLVTVVLLSRLTPWQWGIRWRQVRDQVRHFFAHSRYQILAISAANLIPLTDQWFASWLGEGKVSLLTYADRMIFIPYQLILVGFLHMYHADWSESYYQESTKIFWPKIRKDIRQVTGIVAAGALGMWVFRDFLIARVYGSGNLGANELKALSGLFGWFAVAFVPGVVNLLYSRVLFVMKKAAFCSVYACAQFGANFILDYALMRLYGINGIAAATAVVSSLTALGLHFYLRPYGKNREVVSCETR